MEKHFKAIVENGYQILQTPGGERVNYLLQTTIFQNTKKIGKCIFSANVNYKSELPSLIYDANKQQLKTHSGEILEVKLLEFKSDMTVSSVVVECTVIFPFETKHKEVLASYPTF